MLLMMVMVKTALEAGPTQLAEAAESKQLLLVRASMF
jgi:hypothetical protein